MAPSLASDLAHIQEVKLQRFQGGRASVYFASAILAIVLAYAFAHWSRLLQRRRQLRTTASGSTVSLWPIPLRKTLYGRKIYGVHVLPDRIVLAVVYFGVNIGVSVWDIAWHHYTTFANRLGWVSLCNMCLAILLGIKNAPLSPIAGRSYDSINVLHRWCGYTTIFMMTVHTAVYVAGLFATDYVHLLTTPGTKAADVAGIAMILILLTANGIVRRRHYEFFYVAHCVLIVVSLITVCYHTSRAARHSLYMALIATSIYTLDRALRLSRFFYYLPSNTATLTPLRSSNATRITLTRSVAHAAPGSHAFLYIPSMRAFQSHPFTMVNRDPIEFVVSAREGFTKDLFKAACEKPGRTVMAGVEGAYGNVPDVARYEKVIMFAGGSGATFAFALAVEWAKKGDIESRGSLDFIWSVRTAGQVEGFASELAVLESHPRVNLHVHVTRISEVQAEKPAIISEKFEVVDLHKEKPAIVSETFEVVDLDAEPVKLPTKVTIDQSSLPPYLVPGRPDIHAAVHRAARECEASQRILVAACGPTGLSNSVRDAVKDCTTINGPGLDLHLEAFGC